MTLILFRQSDTPVKIKFSCPEAINKICYQLTRQVSLDSHNLRVSRNFRESPEMEHDLQVSRKCYKISRNLGHLINLIFFCKKSMLLV